MAIDNDTQKKMKLVIAHLQDELRQIRTGRAQPGLVEDLPVDAYGSNTALKGLATISTPDTRSILISPWDQGLVKAVVKAIQDSPLGLNPTADNGQIRLQLPELSTERRDELVKLLHTKAEQARISLRNIREHYLQDIKQSVSAKEASEDDLSAAKKEIQKLLDDYNTEIEQLVNSKTEQIKSI